MPGVHNQIQPTQKRAADLSVIINE